MTASVQPIRSKNKISIRTWHFDRFNLCFAIPCSVIYKNSFDFFTGLFVVSASPPYISMINSSQLMVQKSQSAVIGAKNLQASTNIVGLKSSIKYR